MKNIVLSLFVIVHVLEVNYVTPYSQNEEASKTTSSERLQENAEYVKDKENEDYSEEEDNMHESHEKDSEIDYDSDEDQPNDQFTSSDENVPPASFQGIFSDRQSNDPALDRWIWTTPNNDNPSNSPRLKDTAATDNFIPNSDPCAPYNPPVPDFRAPGRRLSETKCYEHIWYNKLRLDQEKLNTACLMKRAEEARKKNIYFAIGGVAAEPGEFPHMAAIGWQAAAGNNTWVFKCGGSLISAKFVLTAAHCTRTTSRDTTVSDVIPKIVRLGDRNIISTKLDSKIIRIIVHHNYRPPKTYNDIALLELENNVEFSLLLQPACLWPNTNDNSMTRTATVTGWGVINTATQERPIELQAAVLDIIDRGTCDNLLRPRCSRRWCGLSNNQFCAGKLQGGVDACQGDSGGPLQARIPLPTNAQGAMHYIYGVTSFGIGCALQNLPGVYIKVASYLDWIESFVWS